MNILVIGSFMMDLVVRTHRAPKDGETIIGDEFMRFPGGKGANQAVAASRLGASVTMIGKLGCDQFGDEFIHLLKNEGVNIDHIDRDEKHSTGVGSITLDRYGNNRIVVVPGANLNYKKKDLEKVAGLIKKAEIILLQLEMDVEMIEHAITISYENSKPIILNPAPAQMLSSGLLRQVTYLTPNETEAEILTGIKINNLGDAREAAKILRDKGVRNVVITLGENGALIDSANGVFHIEGVTVRPVDTVAAGDAFNGALAFQLVKGNSLEKSVEFANIVGALATTKQGAIPSLPYFEDINRFQEKKGRTIEI